MAEVGGRIIGYVQFGAANTLSDQNEDRELRRLYVHADFQNQGYGGSLMDAALRHPLLKGGANIYLDVWEHNHGRSGSMHAMALKLLARAAFEVESGAATNLDMVMVRRFLPAG